MPRERIGYNFQAKDAITKGAITAACSDSGRRRGSAVKNLALTFHPHPPTLKNASIMFIESVLTQSEHSSVGNRWKLELCIVHLRKSYFLVRKVADRRSQNRR